LPLERIEEGHEGVGTPFIRLRDFAQKMTRLSISSEEKSSGVFD